MHIRQIALVAADLEPTLEALTDILGIELAFRDPGVETFGLHNGVMPIGTSFLEVVSPQRDDTTAGRFLARRGGDGGYMVILQTVDLAGDRKRLEEHSVRVVWEVALDDIETIHLHPRDVGGAIVSIDEPHPPESWRWAGPDWQQRSRTDRCRGIIGVEIAAQDPAGMSRRWAEILGIPVRERDGGYDLSLDPGTVRFVPDTEARGDGVAAVQLDCADGDSLLEAARARGCETGANWVQIAGTRFDISRP